MSKKYVIEIKPEYEDSFKGLMLLGAKDSTLFVDTLAVENLEELNSDYINEYYGSLQDEAYQRGYDNGYEDGCATAFKPVSDAEYQRGLEDAWECAKELFSSMADSDIEKAFPIEWNNGGFKALMNLQPQEAIEKLKAYEEKQKADDEIKVGDEVISLRKNGEVIEDISPWIVTYETKYSHQGFDACGMFHNNPKERVRKTGRHFDIDKILEEMRHD